jgi:hypothetical protein
MKKMGIIVAMALLWIALPLSGQESAPAPEFKQALQELLREGDWSPEEIWELIKEDVDWNQARLRDCEMVAICLGYAEDKDGGIGPEAQAQIALEVMTMAQKMRVLGFGEQQIIRAALNGTREALAELEKLQEQERVRSGEDTGVGRLVRSRFEEQLQTAMHLEARHMVQTRVQEEKDSRPDDLLVPPGPQGPAGPGR